MVMVDPIVQCVACGAKLRLKAASLKVLKQVRCGKCQAMIEIPESLKGDDGPVSDVPVLAKAPAADAIPHPHPHPAPSFAPLQASAPISAPVPAPVPVPRPVAAPAAVSRPDTPAVAPSLRPFYPQNEPVPSAPERLPAPSPSYGASRPSDSELVARVDSLELMVRAQQESISLLTAQLRQIVKAQATAVAAAQALLDR